MITDHEYREFLEYLFEQYVRTRIARVRHRFERHMMDEWHYHLTQAERAASVFGYIQDHCDGDDDVYRTFKFERLQAAVSDSHQCLSFSNRVSEEAGFLDALDAHLREILQGLQPHHLPEADEEVLKDMGSKNPRMEIRGLVFIAKSGLEASLAQMKEVRMREQLRHAEERLERADREFHQKLDSKDENKTEARPKKSRRWFKALGQIGQGAALSIANTALALGILKFPVSQETQTWGAIASVTTGIGTILSGVGDLRNE